MKRKQAAEILALLTAHYPSANLPTETLKVWLRHLEAYPVQQVAEAAERIVNTSRWFPSWAEFRAALTEGGHKSAESAWQVALTGLGRSGGDALIREAVTAVGGTWAFEACQHVPSLRKAFLEAYTAILGRAADARDTELKSLEASPQGRINNGETNAPT